MKAKNYTIAMLIALIFAAANIQAQSARRPVTQEKKERARTASTYKKETTTTKAKNSQPARKTQAVRSSTSNQVRRQTAAHKQPVSTNRGQAVRNQNVSKNNGREYVRNQNANTNKGQQMRNQNAYKAPGQQVRKQNANKQVHKPVSMSTTNNPRSTYRKPNKVSVDNTRYSAPVRSDIYHNRAYYGGHHYHYVYPRTSVKIHYHYNTYMNHYNVLYYPAYGEIYWSRHMYRDYLRWYPGFHWTYAYGYRIQTISVWDAKFNLGEVAMVYGRVYATWYNRETDDYLLFFGGDFPNQQFTTVVPGHIARKFSWRPERFFLGEHITVTGLITTYDGSPEIVIKNRRQLSLY